MLLTAEMFFITLVAFVNSYSFPDSQGSAPIAHPEDELERLTKKMLFDMDNPPSEEYFGKKDISLSHSNTHTLGQHSLFHIGHFDVP